MVQGSKRIYDQSDIEVFNSDIKLGYIPRSDNLIIVKLNNQKTPVWVRMPKFGT